MHKYGKKVLKSENINIFNQECTIYILDNGNCFDVHIENAKHKGRVSETIWDVLPKKHTALKKLDEVYLYEEVVKFALIDKFYGYKDSYYTFDVTNTKEPLEV